VARQFNLIPPIAEQCEYSLLQRDKVELQMPEMYHKIGNRHKILAHSWYSVLRETVFWAKLVAVVTLAMLYTLVDCIKRNFVLKL